ncbi:MAG: sigma-54-dependent Fis family transcriptional regulator [Ignavibacteriales bacterium]|nr:sigma-54-dependent Fis family transcriptional regulator [Ignavibacteriales bacterium]
MKSILVIDDELAICEWMKNALEYAGYYVEYTQDPIEGLEKLSLTDYAILFLDIQMPDMDGLELLRKIRERNIDIMVLIITAHGNIETAVEATKLGAFDLIEKPLDRDKILVIIRNAIHQQQLLKENIELKKTLQGTENIIGESKPIKNILETINRVAKTESRVLITGENGTGKELVAKAIHRLSNRADKPMVEVNCAAIPSELIESELFGHERGSFTGAVKQRIGKFELADEGTLFLDEIGDMSLHAQSKVLRAIEEEVIERVGGNDTIKINVRILAATNKNLQEAITEKTFREDLFHRLNVIPIHVPPLRERREDIPLLIEHFTNEICNKNKFPVKKFSNEAISKLQSMPWKGNVRELRNIIERIVIMIPSDEINAENLTDLLPQTKTEVDDIINLSNSFQEFKEKAERSFILKQLEANNWNISKTADILGIQRSHLYNKMKKYGIEENK